MSHGTPSCRTPRQKNIEEEEAGEIGLLVVEAFKKDKTAKIWGNLFWKNIQGKGKLSKGRSWETLRNFARNASNGLSKFEFERIFPGIPKFGESKASASSSDKKSWLKRNVFIWDPVSVRSVAEKLANETLNIEDETFWTEFQKKHKIIQTADQIRDFFNNYNDEFMKKSKVDEEVAAKLKQKKKDLNWNVFDDDEDDTRDDISEQSNESFATEKSDDDDVETKKQKEQVRDEFGHLTSEEIIKKMSKINTEMEQESASAVLDQKDSVNEDNSLTEDGLQPAIKEETVRAKKENSAENPKSFYDFLISPKIGESQAMKCTTKRKISPEVLPQEPSSKKQALILDDKLRIKTDQLSNEVVEWWLIFEKIGSVHQRHGELLKFLKDALAAIKCLSNCDDAKEDLLVWIKRVIRYRWVEGNSRDKHAAIAVVRTMCLARKSLELSIDGKDLLDIKISVRQNQIQEPSS